MAGLSVLLIVASLGGTARGATMPATMPAAKAGPPKSWPLAFDRVFSGSKLNTRIWDTCYPWANPAGCTNFGNVNDPEQEWYQPSQIQLGKGSLRLVAQREPTQGVGPTGQPKTYSCRSGMITSYPGFSFRYGYIQVTARIPFSKGLWSAFWLAAQNLQWPPEVDILEHWGTQTISRAFLHPVGLPEQEAKYSLPNADHGWHTFSLLWTNTRLTWWFDGHEVYTTTVGVPTQSMYLISNLAVDDASPGGCTGTLYIKSVKIWVPRT